MKKLLKRALAVLVVFALMSSVAVCFAAEPKEKKYYDYGSYVLLGDSVASGWSDVEERETRFVRVEGSYGAHVADDLGVEYFPMACIGFRTVEMRYIFEDGFEPDRFLFYSISDEEMEWRIPLMKKAVAEAGLITLNIGGNDWGSFLGWQVFEEMDKQHEKNEKFLDAVEKYLQQAGADENTVEGIIDLADAFGALPDIIRVLPQALNTGLENFFTNWNYMIEDIYALNPDVTLLVIGMFDNSVQDQETADRNEAALLKLSVSQAIVDFANKPMVEGAEKYGYTFVDTAGTVCEKFHPSAEGHRYIADKILEALPDASFPYEDVAVSSKSYKAIEYMHLNSIMSGVSETKFAPEEKLTKAQLSEAVYNLCEKSDVVESSDSAVKRFEMAIAAFKTATALQSGAINMLRSLSLALNVLLDGGITAISENITRAQAAEILMEIAKL